MLRDSIQAIEELRGYYGRDEANAYQNPHFIKETINILEETHPKRARNLSIRNIQDNLRFALEHPDVRYVTVEETIQTLKDRGGV